MRLFKKLRRRLEYLPPDDINTIKQAYYVAFKAHESQKRRTGEPYITHPVAVACILADMQLDPQTIMAGLLHDVLEDTSIEKIILANAFGEEVAELVDGVSKLTQIEFLNQAEADAENFCKMFLAMANDIRVILVKLADRLHNMRTIGSLPPDKRRRKARETLEIFGPIAKRLGMRDFSVELEELAFQALHPLHYRILRTEVRKARGNRKKVLHLIEETLKKGLETAGIQTVRVIGREKHLYSIYRKMRTKRLSFHEIMDVYAFRIIVKDVDTCYRVLGVAHNLYKPVPERFKDYIAIPKANGYQSLHTTLFGPYGLPIEVQIRSEEMHHMATSGIAADWLYKAGHHVPNKAQVRTQRWLKNLLELQQTANSSLEFIESVKVDLFPDEVYVFTPKGRILELPHGATAIDFAYTIHTDVGNACVAVKVNRQYAPLSYQLSSGETVEVITSSEGRPNPAWLDFVVTSKARSAIRNFLKGQRRKESVQLGKQLLKRALKNVGQLPRRISKTAWQMVLAEAQLQTLDDIYEDIGLGNRMAEVVVSQLQAASDLQKTGTVTPLLAPLQDTAVVIKGTEGMVLHFADCCYPIPGDPIVGILRAGRGILVHAANCRKIKKLREQPQRALPLRWSEETRGEFKTKVQLQIINKAGALAKISAIISDMDSNIDDIRVVSRDDQHHFVHFRLLTKNRLHLANIIRRLRQLRTVVKITRIR